MRIDCCTTMTARLAALILLGVVCLIQTEGVPNEISSVELELGDSVTLSCSFSESGIRFVNWFKQSFGKIAQTVATGVYGAIKLNEPFNKTRFRINATNNQNLLTITSVEKEDEGLYFCQSGAEFSQTFSNGSLLAVKDCGHQTAVYVRQTPDTTDIQPGDSVTLQCSILSKRKETRIQCPDKHSVHWFRAGSENSHPSVLYTHRNSSDEGEERRCVYHLYTIIQNSSDLGTYYCAVVSCGEILFGNGTKLNARSGLDPLVPVLGGLLFCCLTVNFLLLYLIRNRDSGHLKETTGDSQHSEQDDPTENQSNDLNGETKDVNYTTLDLSTINMRHGKKRKPDERVVYSSVRKDTQNQQL